MNCEEYLAMEEFDKAMFMTSLIHVCQSDSASFRQAAEMIELGKRKGLFDKVHFFPGRDTEGKRGDSPIHDIS